MTGSHRSFLILLALFVVTVAATPDIVAAQVRDTIPPPDTAGDTLVAQADTVLPPPALFVRLISSDTALRTDELRGVWRWDREELLRSAVYTLADLLSRVPGLPSFRTGLALQPEAIGDMPGGAGRLEIIRDGYVLDPLDASTLDLTSLSLVELEEVVLERRPGLTRIKLRNAEATEPRPYSRVEAGIGEPEIQTFRGLFLTPRFLFGPFSFGVENVDTEGSGGNEPADAFAAWVRWGIVSENRGITAEVRQTRVRRSLDAPWAADQSRRDLIVRARNRFGPAFVVEAYAGSARSEDESRVLQDPATEGPFIHERSSSQIGLRAGFETGTFRSLAAVRYRTGDWLPDLQADVDAGIGLLDGRIALDAALSAASWEDIGTTTTVYLGASITPHPLLRAFASLETGSRGIAVWPDPRLALDDPAAAHRAGGPIRSDLSSLRAGGELTWRNLRLGGAVLDVSADSVAAFGLPFDSTFRAFAGGDTRGWEAWGRADLFRIWGGTLYAEGGWVDWFDGRRGVYQPAARGNAGLGMHIVPLESGNLEVRGRVWTDHRGVMSAPVRTDDLATLVKLPARSTIMADLMIRIIDVRIFLRYEDLRGENITDIPDRTIRGPRIFYGVKWTFWN
jgi:hypothetical protein